MKCVNCGYELDENAKFCSQCGTPVVDPILPIQPEEEEIPEETVNFDAMEDEPDTVYASLGNDDEDEDYDDFAYQERRAQRQARKAKKSKRNALVFALVGVLLVAALVAVIAKSVGDAKTGKTDASTAEASTDASDRSAIAGSALSGSVVEADGEGKLSEEDLTAAIASIDEKYKAIESARTAGDYQASAYKEGVTAYWKDDAVSAIMAKSGSEGSQYDRAYYYDEQGNLFYADLEGSDAYKLYYKDGELIRLSYAKDAKNAEDVTNYDQSGTQEYLDWEASALDYATTLMTEAKAAGIVKSQEELDAEAEAEKEAEAQEEEKKEEESKTEETKEEEKKEETTETKAKEEQATAKTSRTSGGYIFGDSDSEYIAEEDLKDMSKSQVRLALNEIYARRGATFDSATYKEYFESKSWYKGTISKSEAEEKFNKYEKANVKMLVNYEKSKGWR